MTPEAEKRQNILSLIRLTLTVETGLHLSFVDKQRSLLILLLLSSSVIIGNMFLFIKNMEYIFDPDDKFISEMIK